MASSQPMVPTGGAYGSRQENVEMMQQAGIPLAPPTGGPPVPGAGPGGPPPPAPGPQGQFNPLDLLSSNGPEVFPFLAEKTTDPSVAEPDSTMAALAASAQSSFGLAVLARLQQSQGRRIAEDDPRWNPATMGNRRSGSPTPRRPVQPVLPT